ncbi:ntrilase and fragile histidine triad fusion protein NitFhit isoform X2 [Anticarsia gemmatalis]
MSRKIAVCQMTSVADKQANMTVVSQLISDAAKEDVKMLFFPEACDYICDNKKDTLESAEPIIGGATVAKYRELAAKHDVWLSMGGIHEKDPENSSKTYNTHIIIDNKGTIVQTYRKLHLFDVEIPERNIRLKESDYSMAGNHIVTPVDTDIGKVGLAICYDMRFPELSTALSILKAEVLTYPSAFTQATGAAHWHVLLRSRAIENQCYVIAAAQSGAHNAKRKSYGHALCVDPWGEVLTDCGEVSPCYKIAEINLDKLKDVRRNMPVFEHRRPNVYSLYNLSLRKALLPEHGSPPAGTGSPHSTTSPQAGPAHVFGHVSVSDSCVFYKSALTYAFVNLRCVIPGHVLVAPLRLAERNSDLTDEEAQDFYKTVRLVQKLMEKVHNTNSCTVTIQDGPDAGQTVKHLHCHIMPRKKGDFIENDLIYLELAKHDQFKAGHPSKPPRSQQEMEEEAATLRKEMAILLEEDKNIS